MASLSISYLAFSPSILLVQVVQPYSSTDMATASKNSHFIRRSDFHDNQSVSYNQCFSYAYIDIAFNRCDIATKVYELVN